MPDFPRVKLSLLMQFSLLGLLMTTAIALVVAWGIQRQLAHRALRQAAESAANQVATILDPNLTPDDLASLPGPSRFEQIDVLMRRTVLHHPIVRIKIWGRDGVLMYSDEPELVGRHFPLSEELREALAGKVAMDISSLEKEENLYERKHFSRLFEIYVPLRPMNAPEVAGAYEIYYDTAGLEPGLAGLRRFVWASVGLGFLALYGALFTLVRRASHELMRRNEENARLYSEAKAQLAERQRAEEALRQSEKLAMMGQLLAGVAHELNNPLSVMIGQTDMLRRLAGTAEWQTRTEKIAQAAQRCSRIVRNFLAMARQHPPERQVVVFHQIIAEALELLAYPLRVDGVECHLHLADNLSTLWADPHQLHQMVVNLVANAHHAMRETPPPRQLTLTTLLDPRRGRVILEVADTGLGITPEIQARIFEPFFTTKPLGMGTGLGLSLCQGIVEGHGGTITVESKAGQGTRFRVELPVQPAPAAAALQAPEAAAIVSGRAILVVDDDPEIAEVLAEMLALDGHRVETAPNGLIALDRLGGQEYDLILSDMRMPDLDGSSLYRELQRRHPHLLTRLVFLTGDILSPETSAFLDQTGVVGLSKPFTMEEVRQVVRRLL